MESPSRLTGHGGETLAVASAPVVPQKGMATGAASANCPRRSENPPAARFFLFGEDGKLVFLPDSPKDPGRATHVAGGEISLRNPGRQFRGSKIRAYAGCIGIDEAKGNSLKFASMTNYAFVIGTYSTRELMNGSLTMMLSSSSIRITGVVE
jgi:hypothetical protein